jgi:hypothetical protein
MFRYANNTNFILVPFCLHPSVYVKVRYIDFLAYYIKALFSYFLVQVPTFIKAESVDSKEFELFLI